MKYLVIPTEWLDSDLTYREMIVLAELVNLSQGRKCTASNEYLSDTLKISKKNVSNVISSLQNKGWITAKTERGSRNTHREISIHEKWTGHPQKMDLVSTKSGESKERNKVEKQSKPPLPPEGESHQQRRSDKHSSPVDAPSLPDWLNLEAWSEWESYRKEKKKPITPTARKRQWATLQRYTVQEQRIIIDRSINSGWAGLFELKDQDRPQHKPKVMLG